MSLRGADRAPLLIRATKRVSETFKGLHPDGVSIVLGVGPEPIEVSSSDLIFGSRKLEGALTGDPATGDETLRFSARTAGPDHLYLRLQSAAKILIEHFNL